MKKVFLLMMAALLSVGAVMAQSTKRLNHKLPLRQVEAQVANPELGDMSKDVFCNWYSNILPTDAPSITVPGFSEYGIYSFAERITNNLPVTIDTIAFFPASTAGAGSVTFAIYSEVDGLPGSSLGSVAVSSFQDSALNYAVLPTPVSVSGNYFIVYTYTNDNFVMYTTALRASEAEATAFISYNGWDNMGNVLSAGGQAAYTSLYLYAHGCVANLDDSVFTITAEANDPVMGTVTGGGQYNGLSEATLTATPNEGYRFKFWSDRVTDNPRTVQVMGNATYTAIFAPELNCTKTLPWSDSFEDEDELECWTILDQDGDGQTWYIFSNSEEGQYSHSGNNLITSASWNQDVLTPNNWLISPEVVIPEGGAVLSWWAAPQDANYPEEHYQVRLSATAGLTPADFTETLFEETVNYTTWTAHSVLIENAGTVRFAFVHNDCTDMFRLNLDDISVVANSGETYTVTVNVNPEGAGTVTGAGEYAAGFFATLTVEETNDDYYFVDWSTGETDMTISVQVTEDMTITANFAEKPSCHYTLPYEYGFEDATVNRFCWSTDVFDETAGMGFVVALDPEMAELAHSGNGMAYSSSTLLGFFPLEPVDYLISPEIEIPAGGAYLEFYISNYGGENDHCEVKLAPNAGTSEADFSVSLREVAISGESWQAFHVNIANEGTVRIAFVHTNPSGTGAYLFLDDVKITAGQSTQGIDQVEGEVLATEYYDVLGRRLSSAPAHGVYILRTITTQGSYTQKMMKR